MPFKGHEFADFLLNFRKLQISSDHPNFSSLSMKNASKPNLNAFYQVYYAKCTTA